MGWFVKDTSIQLNSYGVLILLDKTYENLLLFGLITGKNKLGHFFWDNAYLSLYLCSCNFITFFKLLNLTFHARDTFCSIIDSVTA